ncbi:hypothetical protein BESB_025130 [Besnoitia besnoiti]|uniref:High mobility group protein n=1 Tax=Besnoitia besnoiti TaxID=94643 RepID=A0A2A9M7C4_BESBE|nr:uncharacterized protein BESB_025130 [Besnoitia besnoiti]PFH31547.1 hypothetical protein BESB_025130 [Besnoitia besnoiti]
MLSILKNELVTEASKKDVLIRKAELDWFTRNYWIIATQATVVAGFSFQQLASPPPEEATAWSALFHITLTSLSFILALYVIVCCTFSCILAPGLALRGANGFQSVHNAIRYLRKQQDRILWCFMVSLACFVLSSFMIVHVFGRRQRLAVRIETALLFVALAIAFMAARAIMLFQHGSAARSGINTIEENYGKVGDIDAMVGGAFQAAY